MIVPSGPGVGVENCGDWPGPEACAVSETLARRIKVIVNEVIRSSRFIVSPLYNRPIIHSDERTIIAMILDFTLYNARSHKFIARCTVYPPKKKQIIVPR